MKTAVGIAALALAVRMAAWLGACTIGSDSFILLDMARLMGAGEWSSAMRWAVHPAYPAMTAALGGSAWAGAIVAMTLGSVATLPLHALVKAAVGTREALVAALLYAALPAAIDVGGDVMTEGPFTCFFVTAMWAGWRATEGGWGFAPLAGMAAGAAYLTRPEGVLAIVGVSGWLVIEAIRRRTWKPAAMAGVVAASALFVSMPYLLWLRGETGGWTLSLKGGARAASALAGGGAKAGSGALYLEYLRELWRVSCGVLLPFVLWGLWKSLRTRGALYAALFGLGWLAAILYAMPYVGYIGHRYLLVGMVALLPAAAIAWVEWEKRVPARAALISLIALTAVLGVYGAKPRRWHEQSLREAGVWISTRTPGATIIATPEKVAYYAKATLAYRRPWELFPPTLDEFAAKAAAADFVVIAARDGGPAYAAEIDKVGFERIEDDFARGRKGQVPVLLYRRLR